MDKSDENYWKSRGFGDAFLGCFDPPYWNPDAMPIYLCGHDEFDPGRHSPEVIRKLFSADQEQK